MIGLNRLRVLLGAVVTLAAVGPVPLRGQSADFCTQLRTIVGAADTDFRSLRGNPIETKRSATRYWEASTALPGATRCEISQGSDGVRTSYDCTWYIADEERLDRDYRSFIAAVPGCFPNVPARINEERASEFEPGKLRPASARFRFPGDVSLSVRKWTRASSSTGRGRITLMVTRWQE